jgi:hypothetical protein
MRSIFRRNRRRTAITVVMGTMAHATTATGGTAARQVGRYRAETVRHIVARRAVAGIRGMDAHLATLYKAALVHRIAGAK